MVSKKEILDVAKSARVKIDNKDAKKLVPQIKEIIEYFDLLAKAPVDNLSETIHSLDVENVFREDKVEKSLSQEEALKNSKNNSKGYIIGPKTK